MRATKSLLFATLVATAAVLAAPEAAQAQKIQGIRPDVHLNLGFDDFGVGFRIDIPVVPDGWLRSSTIEDEFAISPGLDLMFLDFDGHRDDFCHNHGGRGGHCHDDDRIGFWPVVVAQWNLYFTRSDWSIFPEAGIAFLIGDGYHDGPHDDDDVDVVFAASFGARYHFNDRMSLLMRLNFPAGFQIGLTF